MSRQLEQFREDSQKRKDDAVLVAVEYGLLADLAHSGAVLLGFSVRIGPEDCLVTVRAELDGKEQICFVGASTLGECLVKVCREARRKKLGWRADKFAEKRA